MSKSVLFFMPPFSKKLFGAFHFLQPSRRDEKAQMFADPVR